MALADYLIPTADDTVLDPNRQKIVDALMNGNGALDIPQSYPKNAGEFAPIYQYAERQTGIPADLLVAQHTQESRMNPNIVSKGGAIGLGQILPSTARDPGYGLSPVDPAQLKDPNVNVPFAARYLNARSGNPDWSNPDEYAAALRRYNGGDDPNYVEHVMRFMPEQDFTPQTPFISDLFGGFGGSES